MLNQPTADKLRNMGLTAMAEAWTRQQAEAIQSAAREVARPVVFAVGIIMLVYLPILTLEGIEGKMFRPMAMTVIFALAASLILAVTWVPAMATWIFREGVSEREPWLIRVVRKRYKPIVARVVKRPVVTVAVAFGLFAASAATVPFLGAEFVPTLDEGALAIQAIRLPSVSLEESVQATTRLEKTLLERFPDEVQTVVSKTGRPEIATEPMGVDISDIFVILKPKDDWTRTSDKEELVSLIEKLSTRRCLASATRSRSRSSSAPTSSSAGSAPMSRSAPTGMTSSSSSGWAIASSGWSARCRARRT